MPIYAKIVARCDSLEVPENIHGQTALTVFTPKQNGADLWAHCNRDGSRL